MTSAGELRAALQERGWSIVTVDDTARQAAEAPWAFAERLFGERPFMVERQPIRAIAGGRSFASSNVFTPLHTDSQPCLGAPAHAQVLACVRPAARGGESLLVDGLALFARAERDDPDLARCMLEEPRRIAFYFGEQVTPTISWRRGHVVFTHSPAPLKDDPLGARVQRLVDACDPISIRLEAGQTLVVNNHRMLHGRRAFQDPPGAPSRELARVLVWLDAPFAVDASLRARAHAVALSRENANAGAGAPQGADAVALDDAEAAFRLSIVLELLRGVPPGVLSARERVAESELYAWRDAALTGALSSLRRRPRST